MNNEAELTALAERLKFLNGVYLALFGASIAMLVLQQTTFGFNSLSTIAWAGLLLSAVCVRLYRASLRNKYNAAKGGPML
jgi:hypothetical protein